MDDPGLPLDAPRADLRGRREPKHRRLEPCRGAVAGDPTEGGQNGREKRGCKTSNSRSREVTSDELICATGPSEAPFSFKVSFEVNLIVPLRDQCGIGEVGEMLVFAGLWRLVVG